MKQIEHPDSRDPYVWEPGGVGRYIAVLRDAKPGDEIVLRTPFGRGVLLTVQAVRDAESRKTQVHLEQAYVEPRGGHHTRSGALTERVAAAEKRRAELDRGAT